MNSMSSLLTVPLLAKNWNSVPLPHIVLPPGLIFCQPPTNGAAETTAGNKNTKNNAIDSMVEVVLPVASPKVAVLEF